MTQRLPDFINFLDLWLTQLMISYAMFKDLEVLFVIKPYRLQSLELFPRKENTIVSSLSPYTASKPTKTKRRRSTTAVDGIIIVIALAVVYMYVRLWSAASKDHYSEQLY
jgi:hypothetical protein